MCYLHYFRDPRHRHRQLKETGNQNESMQETYVDAIHSFVTDSDVRIEGWIEVTDNLLKIARSRKLNLFGHANRQTCALVGRFPAVHYFGWVKEEWDA